MTSSNSTRTYEVQPLQELRFELEKNETLNVRLIEGTAEIFGYELAPKVDYPFGNECRGAFFTFDGAKLEVWGSCSTEYIAVESLVPTYLNLHLALEKERILARPPHKSTNVNNNNGNDYNETKQENDDDEQHNNDNSYPCVMVIGDKGSGKTSLAKTLINWAIKSGRARRENVYDSKSQQQQETNQEGEGERGVLLVNLDVSNGGFTIPGTVSMAPVYSAICTATPAHTLGTTYATGQPPLMNVGPDQPKPNIDTQARPLDALCYYYGHTNWSRNEEYLSQALIPSMGKLAKEKIQHGKEGLWRGGMVIDAPTELAEKGKASVLQKVVRAFGVNVLLVLGNEKLIMEIQKTMKTNLSVNIIRVPKSSGASDLDIHYRRRIQALQTHSYFYGGPPLSFGGLSPHSIMINFQFLKIYRVGEEVQAPSSALPVGSTRQIADVQLVEIDPTQAENIPRLVNQVVALLQADDDADESEKVGSPVLGFVHLAAVDKERKKFTILSPVAGRLPRKTGIIGNMDWQDA